MARSFVLIEKKIILNLLDSLHSSTRSTLKGEFFASKSCQMNSSTVLTHSSHILNQDSIRRLSFFAFFSLLLSGLFYSKLIDAYSNCEIIENEEVSGYENLSCKIV